MGNLFLLEEISRPYDNDKILKLQGDVEVPKGTNGRVPNGWSDGSARTAV